MYVWTDRVFSIRSAGAAMNGVCSRGVAYNAAYTLFGVTPSSQDHVPDMSWLRSVDESTRITVVDYTAEDRQLNTRCTRSSLLLSPSLSFSLSPPPISSFSVHFHLILRNARAVRIKEVYQLREHSTWGGEREREIEKKEKERVNVLILSPSCKRFTDHFRLRLSLSSVVCDARRTE